MTPESRQDIIGILVIIAYLSAILFGLWRASKSKGPSK